MNAKAILDLLAGQKSAYRDIVLMNAGAALVVTDIASDLADGIQKAADSIDSGKAAETLQGLVKITKEGTAA